MGSMIQAGGDEMKLVHDAIDSSLTNIGDALDTLERRAGVLRSRWDGAAAEAYESSQREWHRAVRRLHEIAAAVNSAGRLGGDRFEAMDQAHARVWAI